MSSQKTNDRQSQKEAREELLKRLDAKIAEYESKYPTSLSEEEKAQLADHLEITFRNQYRQMSGLAAEARRSKNTSDDPADDPLDK
jgi:hypothetical protein